MKTMIRTVPGSDKAILMIHGILGRPGHFTPFMDAIPADYDIYNILLDGHGGSAKDFAKSGMEIWRKEALDWVSRLTAQYKTVIIAGHSMGCLFAIQAAALHPDRIKALILLAPPLKIRLSLVAVTGSIKTVLGIDDKNDPAAKAKTEACGVALPSNVFLYLSWLPRFMELLKESRSVRSSASSLPVPATVLISSKDELVSPASAAFFPAGSRILKLPNATHYYYPPEEKALILHTMQGICSDALEQNATKNETDLI